MKIIINFKNSPGKLAEPLRAARNQVPKVVRGALMKEKTKCIASDMRIQKWHLLVLTEE
jgi:hypothetical protein